MALIRYRPGDGSETYIEVASIDAHPRGADGTCSYCHGDPCAEATPPGPRIAAYYERNRGAVTCPMCQGRPT